MEERIFNFSAGPGVIAESVLKKAADELLCYPGKGMSVMEMSHRSQMYIDIYDETVALLRKLMNVPENYEILLVQGGATEQFSAIPLNLMVNGKADYVDSGNFAHLAAEEAKRYLVEQMEQEMQVIAATGMQEVLLLTGESRKMSDINYIGEACKLARKYFKVVGLEIYPVNSEEYAYLHKCGADFVTIFQETYNSEKYGQLHLAGHKRCFPYRFYGQERALKGGMRGVGLAALLGLDDFRRDAFSVGVHAYLLQRKFPHAEIALACPRLRPIINNDKIQPLDVGERQLLQIVCAYRLFLPYASITVSSRECARVRDNLMSICANKISAGVSTGVGSHGGSGLGDEQFEIDDGRSLAEIFADLKGRGLQPVMADYVYV